MKGTKILLFLVVLSCSSFSFSSSSSSPSSSPGLLVEKRRCADQQCLGTVEDTKKSSSCSFIPISPSVNVISRRIFLPKYFVTQIVKSNFVKRQTGQKKAPAVFQSQKIMYKYALVRRGNFRQMSNMLWFISLKCLFFLFQCPSLPGAPSCATMPNLRRCCPSGSTSPSRSSPRRRKTPTTNSGALR